MCGIAGISGKIITSHLDILNDLGNMLRYRGEHATGIAFNNNFGLQIKKAPISPSQVDFASVFAFEDGLQGKVIFHNRYFTNGNPKENKNNHPFRGTTFALAHNGVLNGYRKVASEQNIVLTNDEPETDSYVLVKLIDKFLAEGLTMKDAIANTCNLFKGSSLCLEILTDNNELYLVRGDVYSFDLFEIGENEYVYASSPTGKYNANASQNIVNVIFNYLQSYLQDDMIDKYNYNHNIDFRIKQIDVPKYSIVVIDGNGKLEGITPYAKDNNFKIESNYSAYCGTHSDYSRLSNYRLNLFGEEVLDEDDEEDEDSNDTSESDILDMALCFAKDYYPKSSKKGLSKLPCEKFVKLLNNYSLEEEKGVHPITTIIKECLWEETGFKNLDPLADVLADNFAKNYTIDEIKLFLMQNRLCNQIELFVRCFWSALKEIEE